MSKDGIYICADIGCHWMGDWERMEWMIEGCAASGVDAVKLQMFDGLVLERQYPQEMRERLSCMTLSPLDVSRAAIHAHDQGIELVVTPFDKGLVDSLAGVPVDGMKVRAKDYLDAPLVKAVRDSGKPYYLSFPVVNGETTVPKKEDGTPVNEADVKALYDHWFYTLPPKGHRVFCISKYPPELKDIQLKAMGHNWHGFSNHYPHVAVPLMAAALAIDNQMRTCKLNRFYLEVHVMPNHSVPGQYLDWAVSLSFDEIRHLCKSVAIMEEAIG